MRIGLSFWGFLGPGVLDTPDGGRFWRRPIVDELLALGHDVVLLQKDRDGLEAGDALPYQWHQGFPPVDVLFCEWRWPLPGRNTTPCGADGHTCDLHRQTDLIFRYTIRSTTPTVIWDTDRQLAADDELRELPHVIVGDPALLPTPGTVSLLAPVPDHLLDEADPQRLAARHRPLPLAYVGNQYDRDHDFEKFFVPAAARFRHRVAGKWQRTSRWPAVTFTGRCPFPEVQDIYRGALCTVLLNPRRYSSVGAVSQRRFEGPLAGCLPIAPTTLAQAAAFTPEILHAADGGEVIDRIEWALGIAGSKEHADLIETCLSLLSPFRLSAWAVRLTRLMESLTHSTGADE
ncbi:hypothetical protein GCM10029978_068310 [Actinoallomurus acanthiterrae]